MRPAERARQDDSQEPDSTLSEVSDPACTHLDTIDVIELPDPLLGCEECLKTGDRWVHLRMCLTCGKVGCCDSSPNRHASGHYREVGHTLVRSAQPGEDWAWCFADEVPISYR
jgi:uncharacterized UBP type Zn finger protein